MSATPHELRWMRWVAIAAFAAGLAVGLAFGAFEPSKPSGSPEEGYVSQFARAYALSPDQVRKLRMILAAEVTETTEVLRGEPEKLPPEVRKVRRRTDQRIRAMLTDEQREAYDRDKETR